MDVMNERLKKLRKIMKKSQEEFGEILGISKSGVSAIESGRRQVTKQHIKMLINYGISEEWLKNETGKPMPQNQSAIIEQLKKELHLSDFDCIVISEYLSLDEEDRAAVRRYYQGIRSAMGGGEETQASVDTSDIESRVQEYRRQLELEKEAEVRSGAS